MSSVQWESFSGDTSVSSLIIKGNSALGSWLGWFSYASKDRQDKYRPWIITPAYREEAASSYRLLRFSMLWLVSSSSTERQIQILNESVWFQRISTRETLLGSKPKNPNICHSGNTKTDHPKGTRSWRADNALNKKNTFWQTKEFIFFSILLLTSIGSKIKLACSDFFRSYLPRQLWSSSKCSCTAHTSVLSKLQLVTESGPWSWISLPLLLCV